MSTTLDYAGDPNIGVFCRVMGDLAVVSPTAPGAFADALREELGVEVVRTTIQESEIVGSLLSGNSRGMIVSGLALEQEIGTLEEYGEVMQLRSGMNAAGNVILANDRFAALHPDMDPEIEKEIAAFLKVPAVKVTFGGVKTVGMAAVATNSGVLVHPRTTRTELAALSSVTDLPIGTGSVNLGGVLVGSGLVANTRGYIAGTQTSGFELGRIEEVFGFVG
ncbi:MAG: translation initiation factor IF-6 [Methanomicrobiales archaeon]|nr:translation initiation factor IF-6 [Methanomicrobiales archaeon]MDI6875301.1 translation initiation factor IF-6 [Methanomicrobiales archaeon]